MSLRVPFLGTSWQERGRKYWRRRLLGSLVFLMCTVFAGAFAVGCSIGFFKAAPVLGYLYALTGVFGVRPALRQVRAAPVTLNPTFGNRVLFVVSTPALAVAMLTIFIATLGRDFLGERWAREHSPG